MQRRYGAREFEGEGGQTGYPFTAAPAAFGRGWLFPLNARGPRGRGRGGPHLRRHGAKTKDRPTHTDPAIMTLSSRLVVMTFAWLERRNRFN